GSSCSPISKSAHSVLRSAVELVNITSTHCCSKVGCVFRTAVRAMSSCAADVSLPRHERLSALGCFDYDVGVPTYTRVSVFSARLGDVPVVDWRGRNATNL